MFDVWVEHTEQSTAAGTAETLIRDHIANAAGTLDIASVGVSSSDEDLSFSAVLDPDRD